MKSLPHLFTDGVFNVCKPRCPGCSAWGFRIIVFNNKAMDKELFEIRKNKVLEFMESELYVPMREKELLTFFCTKKTDRDDFRVILYSLLEEGRVVRSKRGKITLSPKALCGTYEAHTGGFGFVTVENREKDIYIKYGDSIGAMNGDVVEAEITRSFPDKGRRDEGIIKRIVSRAVTEVVGTYDPAGKKGTYGFVIPDDSRITDDIFVAGPDSMDAVRGMKVVVRILKYGDRTHRSEGKITGIIGMKDDPGVDIESVVRSHGLPEDFPEEVLKEADKAVLDVNGRDISGRRDLRELLTVTIDSDDAKDLDDAVSLTKDGNGNYELGVHIADVSEYVREKSLLDKEALNRGTSVYLADRVIPMLPTVLSNGSCSLNPKEDRLTLSCLMKISPEGKILESEICESVIRTNRRMSYDEVLQLIDGTADSGLIKECEHLIPLFRDMAELSDILISIRKKRGAVDFDFPETKIILDDKGHVTGLEPRLSNRATKIIESFMLAANETVAETCTFQELPFIYRTHEEPDPEKIKALREYVVSLGYSLKISRDGIHPKEIQKLLKSIEGTPEETLIARMTLRSMRQAKYTTEPVGHFGLADRYYCHFTSPIRRYPDLQVHRIIKEELRGKLNRVRISHYDELLPKVAQRSSERERQAMETEREVEKLKKVEYMLSHIGDEYEGVVSGINAYGIYVELPDTVEGMVRMSDIPDDFYVFNEALLEARGRHSGKTYRMGDPVKVVVAAADKDLRTIDFVFVNDDNKKSVPQKRSSGIMVKGLKRVKEKRVKKHAAEKDGRKKADSK